MDQKYFIFPFADTGDLNPIPDDEQGDGSVSFEKGFPSDYELEQGVDPNAKDVPRPETNSLYRNITENIKQYQEHGYPEFILPVDNDGLAFAYDLFSRVIFGGAVYENRANGNLLSPGDPAPNGWQMVDRILDFNQSGEILPNSIWMIDSTGGPVSRDMPSNPNPDQIFSIRDDQGFVSGNPATLNYDGSNTIMGLAENMIITTDFSSATFKFKASTSDWRLISE